MGYISTQGHIFTKRNSLSSGPIAGITIGTAVVVIAAIVAMCFFFRQRRNKQHFPLSPNEPLTDPRGDDRESTIPEYYVHKHNPAATTTVTEIDDETPPDELQDPINKLSDFGASNTTEAGRVEVAGGAAVRVEPDGGPDGRSRSEMDVRPDQVRNGKQHASEPIAGTLGVVPLMKAKAPKPRMHPAIAAMTRMQPDEDWSSYFPDDKKGGGRSDERSP